MSSKINPIKISMRALEILAEETIPIAKVRLVLGPLVSSEVVLGEGDVHIVWSTHILDRSVDWERFMCQTTIRSIDRENENYIRIIMTSIKEAYMKKRDEVSNINSFRENYRKMLGIIYSDPKWVEAFHQE